MKWLCSLLVMIFISSVSLAMDNNGQKLAPAPGKYTALYKTMLPVVYNVKMLETDGHYKTMTSGKFFPDGERILVTGSYNYTSYVTNRPVEVFNWQGQKFKDLYKSDTKDRQFHFENGLIKVWIPQSEGASRTEIELFNDMTLEPEGQYYEVGNYRPRETKTKKHIVYKSPHTCSIFVDFPGISFNALCGTLSKPLGYAFSNNEKYIVTADTANYKLWDMKGNLIISFGEVKSTSSYITVQFNNQSNGILVTPAKDPLWLINENALLDINHDTYENKDRHTFLKVVKQFEDNKKGQPLSMSDFIGALGDKFLLKNPEEATKKFSEVMDSFSPVEKAILINRLNLKMEAQK